MQKPKLLLDENIGSTVAAELRLSKFDVLNIAESKPGMADINVLDLALKQKRIVITLDKDFGQLVYAYSRKHAGVILLRLTDESPKNISKILNLIFKQHRGKLKNKFVAATETKIRLR
jgi:predicted nuclease of predicted toxin-antitoxin system